MKEPWYPNCLATGIGSLPHHDLDKANALIRSSFGAIPFWPQLPKRSQLENMYVQYSEHLPSRVVDDGRVYLQTEPEDLQGMEQFYEQYLTDDPAAFAIGPDHASALHDFLSHPPTLETAVAIKGQTTGPVSFGLQVTNEARKALIYSDIYRDIYVKNLQMKARWQEMELMKLHERTIMFIDEPYLSAIGSGVINLNREIVRQQLLDIHQGLQGLTGIHCCGNTDWSLLLDLPYDIVSFDAYEYATNLFLFTDELKAFLDRGGILAWGIVPSTSEQVMAEDLATLERRFDELLVGAEKKGFDRDQLLSQALITPSCGVGSQTVEVAERVFTITSQLAKTIRDKYHL